MNLTKDIKERARNLGSKIEYIVSHSDGYPNTAEEVQKAIMEDLDQTAKAILDAVEERIGEDMMDDGGHHRMGVAGYNRAKGELRETINSLRE